KGAIEVRGLLTLGPHRLLLQRLLLEDGVDVGISLLAELIEHSPPRAVGGNLVRLHPLAAGMEIEVLAWADSGVAAVEVDAERADLGLGSHGFALGGRLGRGRSGRRRVPRRSTGDKGSSGDEDEGSKNHGRAL